MVRDIVKAIHTVFFVWFTVEIALVEAVVVLGLSFGKMFLQFAVFCYALSNALVA